MSNRWLGLFDPKKKNKKHVPISTQGLRTKRKACGAGCGECGPGKFFSIFCWFLGRYSSLKISGGKNRQPIKAYNRGFTSFGWREAGKSAWEYFVSKKSWRSSNKTQNNAYLLIHTILILFKRSSLLLAYRQSRLLWETRTNRWRFSWNKIGKVKSTLLPWNAIGNWAHFCGRIHQHL